MSNERPKVAVVHAVASHVYGSERVMLDLLQVLLDADQKVQVYLPETGPLVDKIHELGVESFSFPFLINRFRKPDRSWAGPIRVLNRLLRDRVKLLHCTSLSPLPSFLPGARLLDIPVVAQAQTIYDSATIRRSFCRSADLLLPVSTACAHPLAEFLGPDLKHKLRVIPPLIREPHPRAGQRGQDLRQSWGVTRDQIVVGYLGQLIPRKGVDRFLKALAILGQTEPGIVPVMVGGDPQPGQPTQRSLQEMAQQLALSPTPRFTGPVDDSASYLAAMDILVLPSRVEGLGLVLGEAMLAGTAVIGANTGGIPDLVRDGETGLLAPPDESDALARAIERLVTDSSLRIELAAAGARLVRNRFSAASFGKEILAAHDQAIGARGR